MSAQPKVYIVVLNWNGSSDTIECLQAISLLDYPNFEVLVCDNDSKAPDQIALKGWMVQQSTPRMTFLQTGANLGYAGGVNVGLRHALQSEDLVFAWVLNNDTQPAPDALSRLVERAQQDGQIGICGATLLLHHDPTEVQALGGADYLPWRARCRALGAFQHVDVIPADPAEIERRLAYVNGASMLVSARYLQDVGLMDERFFLYSEEHDWAQRGRQKGFKLGYAPGARVLHKHGATIGTSPSGGSTLSLYYLYRNKLVFAAWHHPYTLPVSFCFLVWEALKLALKGHPDKCWAVLRGLLAARTLAPY